MGVPTLGCDCAVCTSADPRDRRLRPSVLLRWQGSETARERVVVIDTGPDFREQALRKGLTRVDAVFYTHPMPTTFSASTICARSASPFFARASQSLFMPRRKQRRFWSRSSITHSRPTPPTPTAPGCNWNRSNPLFRSTSVDFLRVPVLHGEQEISGFRFGSTAYLTDVSAIPESSFALLEGLDHLILSALRHKPHPNHATVEQAAGWARHIGAKQTWFTHIAHELGHEETNRTLPDNIRLAYDGLTLEVNLAIQNRESRTTGAAASA